MTNQEEQEERLVDMIDLLEDALADATTRDERRHLGVSKPAIQCVLSARRPDIRRRDLAHLFIDAAYEMVEPAVFEAIMAEAKRLSNAQKGRKGRTVD